MQGAYKSFDRKLYSVNDNAKELAIEYFKRLGMSAIVNPNEYGVDLIVDNQFYCEVEVKHNWKGNSFPFPTLQIPERKKKFATLDKPVVFMVMSSDRTKALVAKDDDVLSSPLKTVSNKYVKNGEKFFQVDVSMLREIKIGI